MVIGRNGTPGYLFALVVLFCTTPALTMEVQFHDQEGNLLTEVDVEILTIGPNGERQSYMAASMSTHTFDIPVEEGRKILLQLHGHDGVQYAPVWKVIDPRAGNPLPISVRVLAEDQCADYIPIEVNSVTAGSTTGAISDPLVAGGGCGTTISDPSAGQWYGVIGTGNVLRASTCASESLGSADFDTKISVYCLGCETLACVGGNDDADGCDPALRSTAEFCTQPDQEYLIYVHGFLDATGSFNLEVSDLGTPCIPWVDCVPPEPGPPTGACCSRLAPSFNCTIETEARCLARTNDPNAYQGDDTSCQTETGGNVIVVTEPNAPIPAGNPIGLTDTLEVVDDTVIEDLNVDLEVTHTWVGDLVVTLTGPDGTQATIVNRMGVPETGNGCHLDNLDIVLDDEGTGGAVEDLCDPVMTSPPNYTPASPLDVFDGKKSGGTWTLLIVDDSVPDSGTLDRWSLHIAEGEWLCSDTSGPCEPGGDGQVMLCHVPPGNPTNAQTITVEYSEAEWHLERHRNDYLGPCNDRTAAPAVEPGQQAGPGRRELSR